MRAGLLIRIIYALCLLGATVNHVRAVHAHGWMPSDLPWITAAYWSSLTLLDPLAAILLFIRPKIGIAATIAIIFSDVVHNLWFRAGHPVTGSFYHDVTSSPFMMSQIAFLLFVAVTAPIAWKDCLRSMRATDHAR
jgi:hypothetical protein